MNRSRYTTMVTTDDVTRVERTAYEAAHARTLVDRVEAWPVCTFGRPTVAEVVVEFQSLNDNEAAATARAVRTALGYVGPTDEGRTVTTERG